MEKLSRQTDPPVAFDGSQKGNWENVRNEVTNGRPFRFRSEIFETPPSVREHPVALCDGHVRFCPFARREFLGKLAFVRGYRVIRT